MKKLLLIILILLAFCKMEATAYEVVVYGTDNCGFTLSLRNSLDNEGITYTYKNLDSLQYRNEFWSLVIRQNISDNGNVLLPVVRVMSDKEYGLMRPTVDQIKALITGTHTDEFGNTVSPYPNPTSGIFYVHGERYYEVYDSNGVKFQSLYGEVLNLSDLKPGMYILMSDHEFHKIIKR